MGSNPTSSTLCSLFREEGNHFGTHHFWNVVRVVKEMDLKSIGLCPRRFKPDTFRAYTALIAQLGERQTEDLKVLCSIHS